MKTVKVKMSQGDWAELDRNAKENDLRQLERGSIHVIKPSERDLMIRESPREFELTLEAPEGMLLRRMVFRGRPHSRIGRFLSRFITFEGIVTWEEEP